MGIKRSVIITGAGAVIPWGAPRTDELTSLLRKDLTFINDKGEPIGEYLYTILDTRLGKESRFSRPNFETILYLIEKIYEFKTSVYHMSSSFFRLNDFFILKDDIVKSLNSFEKDNPNFHAIGDSQDKFFLDTSFNTNCLIIGNGFYEQLYRHFVYLIKNRIDQYEMNFDNYIDLNKHFNNFIKSLKERCGVVRYYTANYDYLPIKISDINFFDGYDSNQDFDRTRVIEDNSVDSYYHLHGSFKLNLERAFSDDLSNVLSQASFTKNNLISSNIISGFNKLDRIFSEPYFQFFNKLVEDCYNSDQIFIIGYSFNDLHINTAIMNALKRDRTKIVCIDRCNIKCFNYNYRNILPSGDYNMRESTSNPNVYDFTTESPKAKVYLDGFENYLSTF